MFACTYNLSFVQFIFVRPSSQSFLSPSVSITRLMSLRKTVSDASVGLAFTSLVKQKCVQHEKTVVFVSFHSFTRSQPGRTAQWQRGFNNKHLTLPGRSRSYIDANRWNTVQFSQSAVFKHMQNIIDIHTLPPGWCWSGDLWIRCKWGPKTQRSHIQPAILPLWVLRKPALTKNLKSESTER